MGLDVAAENAAVVLTGFHHHGEVSELGGAVVNVEAVEIVLKNALRGVALADAVCSVDLHEHVESVDENVPAAHTWVDELDILWLEVRVLGANFLQFGFYICFLLGFVEIVFPVFFERVVWMTVEPEASEAVFDHVAHDPIWCEQLGGGWDAFFGDFYVFLEQGVSFFFEFFIVILIQPADDLHLVGPVFFWDVVHEVAEDAVGFEDVVWQEKFGVTAEAFEHTRQGGVQRVALGEQKIAIEIVGLVLLDIGGDFLLVEAIELEMEHVGEDLWLKGAAGVGEHADVAWQIIVHFHVAQGDETVEPSVGNFFHDLVIAFDFNLLYKLGALALLVGRQSAAVDGDGVFYAVGFFGDAVLIRTLGHLRNHLRACPDGKFLNGVFIHEGLLLFN